MAGDSPPLSAMQSSTRPFASTWIMKRHESRSDLPLISTENSGNARGISSALMPEIGVSIGCGRDSDFTGVSIAGSGRRGNTASPAGARLGVAIVLVSRSGRSVGT